MLDAAIAGLGRWGRNYVNAVQGVSERLRFTRGIVTHPDKSREFAAQHRCSGACMCSATKALPRPSAPTN